MRLYPFPGTFRGPRRSRRTSGRATAPAKPLPMAGALHAESLERRVLLAAPKVDAVLLDSSAWTTPFRDYLAAQGLGGANGYSIPGGASQTTTLPWVNVDRIRVRFNQAVNVTQNDLYLRGVNANAYAFSGFSYDTATNTGTWTLAAPLPHDRYSLYVQDTVTNGAGERLDGEWRDDGTGAYPSGDGSATGIFRFRFNLVPADVTRDGRTNALDLASINPRVGRSTTNPGTPPSTYTAYHDVDGNGAITNEASTGDVDILRSHLNKALPSVPYPLVSAVLVDSTAWTADFRSHLAAQGLGSGGYAIPSGPAQLDELPWININQVKVRFDQDVNVVPQDLTLRGAGAVYSPTAFAFDPATSTATWTLPSSLPADRLAVNLKDAIINVESERLNGDWVNAVSTFPSGDAFEGGQFNFRFNVLPGDVERDGDVDGTSTTGDQGAVQARLNTSTTSPGTPPNTYTPFHDVNGTGNINALDSAAVQARLGTALPAANPPPGVAAVLVDSTQWTADFRNYLSAQGLGTGGYSIPSGPDQFKSLPWYNLDQITVRFTEDVFVQAGDLRIFGTDVAEYLPSGFAYDAATFTATWTLPTYVNADKLLLDLDADGRVAVTDTSGDALDGEFASGRSAFPSGNGQAGTDFKFRLNVLPGDAQRDGDVDGDDTSGDVGDVKARLNTSTTSPGTPPNTYNAFVDVNGSGNVNALDLAGVKARLGKILPAAEPAAPTVVGVSVDSTGWTAAYRSYLAAQGMGANGFAIPGGAAQADELPWINIDQVRIRFSEPVTVSQGDLLVRGVNTLTYTVSGFSYDAVTNTGTWTLSSPVSAAERLLLHLRNTVRDAQNDELDGEWNNGAGAYPSGDGNAGGAFQFRLNVLPGDVERDGDVDGDDFTGDKGAVKARLNTSTTSPGTPPNTYNAFADVNGSGNVNALDLAAVNGRLGTALPAGQPAALALPTAPGGFDASVLEGEWGIFTDKVVAQWQDVADETAYRVERSVNGASGWEVIGEVPAGVTTFTKYDIGRTYSYRVRAINAAGASAPSSAVRPPFYSELEDLKVTAQVTSSPVSKITLTWPQRTDRASYQVFRRARDAWTSTSPWTAVSGLLPRDATSFTDATVQAGVVYEYQVSAPVFGQPGSMGGHNYVLAAVQADTTSAGQPTRYDNRGKAILLVEESLLTSGTGLPSLLPEIQRLIRDLVGDGWTVVGRDGAPWSTANGTVPRHVPSHVDTATYKARVAAVKGYIQTVYDSDPTNVEAVFLLGNVPIPYSGFNATDGHSTHKGAWPADVYYGDVAPDAGQSPTTPRWNDVVAPSQEYLDSIPRPENKNFAGDGKFDEDDLGGGRAPELMVGRVDLSDLPAFTQTGESAAQAERRLLVRYLDKDHAFRHKQFNPQRRALIDDDLSQTTGSGWIAFRNAASTVGPSAVDVTEYFPTLQNSTSSGYLFASGFSYGFWYGDPNNGFIGGTTQGWVGHGDPAVGIVTWDTTDFAAAPTKGVFNTLFGSYIGDWDVPNSFLRGAIAAEGYGLTSSWGTAQDEFYHHMGLGEPIGFSMRATLNSYKPDYYRAYNINLADAQRHQTVLGDPTLRMHVVAPPSNVTETAVSGGVQLNWTASPEPGVQTYAIYVAPTAAGPFTKVAAGVSGTTYTHAGGSTASVYMVRALRLETVPSGTYYNASQGAFSDEGGSMMLMAPDTQTAAAPSTGDGRPSKKKSAFSDQPITRSTLKIANTDELDDSLAALLA